MPGRWIIFGTLIAAVAAGEENQIQLGRVDFFGYEGVNLQAVRHALPFREAELPVTFASAAGLKRTVREAVAAAIGESPTDVATVCCDDSGRWMLYVGLPGQSSHSIKYRTVPDGNLRLPEDAVALSEKEEEAWKRAVSQGIVGEDGSPGYALAEEPTLRSRQLAIRNYAIHHEERLYRVVESSSDARHRAIAAHMLGYARQTKRQIRALVRVSRDADSEVRNNAIRALGVLASSSARLAQSSPAEKFVEQLASGVWEDRNKAASLLERLSQSRDPKLLAQLRSEAVPALIEMARWGWSGHAMTSRLLIGRIAGIDESTLNRLALNGDVDGVIAVLRLRQ